MEDQWEKYCLVSAYLKSEDGSYFTLNLGEINSAAFKMHINSCLSLVSLRSAPDSDPSHCTIYSHHTLCTRYVSLGSWLGSGTELPPKAVGSVGAGACRSTDNTGVGSLLRCHSMPLARANLLLLFSTNVKKIAKS